MNVLDHLAAGTPLFVAHNDSGIEATAYRWAEHGTTTVRVGFEPRDGVLIEGDAALDDIRIVEEEDVPVWLEVPSHKLTNQVEFDLDNLETWQ